MVWGLGFRIEGLGFKGLGFSVDKLQGNIQCIAACEVLPWPDRRRPSNTFTHPTPSEAAKPPKPTLFRGQT